MLKPSHSIISGFETQPNSIQWELDPNPEHIAIDNMATVLGKQTAYPTS